MGRRKGHARMVVMCCAHVRGIGGGREVMSVYSATSEELRDRAQHSSVHVRPVRQNFTDPLITTKSWCRTQRLSLSCAAPPKSPAPAAPVRRRRCPQLALSLSFLSTRPHTVDHSFTRTMLCGRCTTWSWRAGQSARARGRGGGVTHLDVCTCFSGLFGFPVKTRAWSKSCNGESEEERI